MLWKIRKFIEKQIKSRIGTEQQNSRKKLSEFHFKQSSSIKFQLEIKLSILFKLKKKYFALNFISFFFLNSNQSIASGKNIFFEKSSSNIESVRVV